MDEGDRDEVDELWPGLRCEQDLDLDVHALVGASGDEGEPLLVQANVQRDVLGAPGGLGAFGGVRSSSGDVARGGDGGDDRRLCSLDEVAVDPKRRRPTAGDGDRSEEHTSELQ